MGDLINRQEAIRVLKRDEALVRVFGYQHAIDEIQALPSAEPEEVIPHRNYKYLSDYWCECGWHLGKKGEVKYCAECGRKVNWDG